MEAFLREALTGFYEDDGSPSPFPFINGARDSTTHLLEWSGNGTFFTTEIDAAERGEKTQSTKITDIPAYVIEQLFCPEPPKDSHE
jgi:hypothetical protein